MGVSKTFWGKSRPVLLSVAVCEGTTFICVFHVYYIIVRHVMKCGTDHRMKLFTKVSSVFTGRFHLKTAMSIIASHVYGMVSFS